MAKNGSATSDALGSLHAVVAKELRARIESGEATAADISNAIKFLKDNGISCDVNDYDNLKHIADEVPVFLSDAELKDVKY